MRVNIDDYDDQFVDLCKICDCPLDDRGNCPLESVCCCGIKTHNESGFCSKQCEASINDCYKAIQSDYLLREASKR